MSDLILQALEFGVLGLCAITLVLVWRIINSEQNRENAPRKSILHAAYFFMMFSFTLALINGYVQLQQPITNDGAEEIQAQLQSELRQREDQLLQIRSAANPILNARSNILDRLPSGSERDTLMDLIESLRTVLNEDGG